MAGGRRQEAGQVGVAPTAGGWVGGRGRCRGQGGVGGREQGGVGGRGGRELVSGVFSLGRREFLSSQMCPG